MKNNKLLFTVLILSAVLLMGSIFYLSRNHFEDEYVYTPENLNSTNQQNTRNQQAENNSEVDFTEQSESEQLQYLIEEEKLAYDVYTVFYNEYGARVFGNILESESTHQSRVLEVMNSKNVEDPRSPEAGKFTDESLQELYDSLIARGLTSQEEAYRVGVVIEEKDIADLSVMIEESSDDYMTAMLQDLKKGSENHLVAFNKQLQ